MDVVKKRRLERIARNHAAAIGDGQEGWSFLFRTEGAVDYLFCPLSSVNEFDGDLTGLDVPWEPERVTAIEAGADLSAEEFAEWQRAYCDEQIEAGADDVWPIWIVPIRLDGQVEGYASFLCQDDDPTLDGVYETIEQAEAVLRSRGALK